MPGWRPRRRRECLLALEEMDAAGTATRARVLAVFAAARGYAADGDYSPRSWLIHRTRITICQWSDKLPPDCRDAADAILVAAAAAGAELPDLVQLAAEMYARSLPDPGEDGDRPDEVFEDRKVRVETTFAGAGVMSGDLTPECAAVVTAVLESLSAPMGAEDTRTREQRYHDGLQEAMRRLVASGLLPERAGQPVKVWAFVSLAELRALDDGSVWSGCAWNWAGVPGTSRQAQGRRRPHQSHQLRLAVLVSPPGGDPPAGLDPRAQPGRDHHRVEPGPDQGPAQPRTPRPRRVTPRLRDTP